MDGVVRRMTDKYLCTAATMFLWFSSWLMHVRLKKYIIYRKYRYTDYCFLTFHTKMLSRTKCNLITFASVIFCVYRMTWHISPTSTCDRDTLYHPPTFVCHLSTTTKWKLYINVLLLGKIIKMIIYNYIHWLVFPFSRKKTPL